MASNNFTLDLKAKVDVNSVKQQLKQISNTTTLKINVDGTKAITEMNKFESKVGDVYTEMKKLDGEGNVLSSTFTKTTSATKNLSGTIEGLGRKLQSINGIFQATKNLVVNFQQFLEPLFEFEDALTELKKVSDLSNESLAEYTKNLGSMGQEVGKSRTEMTEAATEFVKSGFSEEDSATLARVATLYQNIADEELDAGESANFIISQMKAFNMTAQDAEHIIDAVNEV
jgi:chromosome segregation ATPase